MFQYSFICLVTHVVWDLAIGGSSVGSFDMLKGLCFFNWSAVDLQCCVNFCTTTDSDMYIYMHIYIYSFLYSFQLWSKELPIFNKFSRYSLVRSRLFTHFPKSRTTVQKPWMSLWLMQVYRYNLSASVCLSHLLSSTTWEGLYGSSSTATPSRKVQLCSRVNNWPAEVLVHLGESTFVVNINSKYKALCSRSESCEVVQ